MILKFSFLFPPLFSCEIIIIAAVSFFQMIIGKCSYIVGYSLGKWKSSATNIALACPSPSFSAPSLSMSLLPKFSRSAMPPLRNFIVDSVFRNRNRRIAGSFNNLGKRPAIFLFQLTSIHTMFSFIPSLFRESFLESFEFFQPSGQFVFTYP